MDNPAQLTINGRHTIDCVVPITSIVEFCIAAKTKLGIVSLPLDVGQVVDYSGNAVSNLYIKPPNRHFTRAMRGDQSPPVNNLSHGCQRKISAVSPRKRGQVSGWDFQDRGQDTVALAILTVASGAA
jgi:hypothetical protein